LRIVVEWPITHISLIGFGASSVRRLTRGAECDEASLMIR
jgi:hypothetical protein